MNPRDGEPTGGNVMQHISEEKQLLIQSDNQQPMNPSVVLPNDTDFFIVAGSSGYRVWATKINSEGKTIWTYYIDKPPGYDKAPWLQTSPSEVVLVNTEVAILSTTIVAPMDATNYGS